MIAFDGELRVAPKCLFFFLFFPSKESAMPFEGKTLSVDQIFRAAQFFFFSEKEGNIKRTDVQTHVALHHVAVQTVECERGCCFCWRLIAVADLIEFN